MHISAHKFLLNMNICVPEEVTLYHCDNVLGCGQRPDRSVLWYFSTVHASPYFTWNFLLLLYFPPSHDQLSHASFFLVGVKDKADFIALRNLGGDSYHACCQCCSEAIIPLNQPYTTQS